MAVVALRRAFSLTFSGWRVGPLYPLAGWQPRRAAGRRFLFDGMTAALAAASASYGVSVAERLATMAVVALRRAFSLTFSGWRVGTLYPLAGWQPRRAAGRRFLFDGMTAALAAASASYGVSVAERLATMAVVALRRAFSLTFPAGASVLFIHWRGGSRAARRAGDFFLWNDGGAGRGVGELWGQRAEAARNVAVVALRRAFSLDISGWRVGTLYPLAGWQPRRAAGRRFLFDRMTAALAAASARYGVSVAERLATAWPDGSPAGFSLIISGWRVGTLYPLAGWQPRRAAGRRFLFDGMTAALAGRRRAMGSASPRPARNGVAVMALRRAFSLTFPAGASVLFIHWRGGSRAARRAGDFFLME